MIRYDMIWLFNQGHFSKDEGSWRFQQQVKLMLDLGSSLSSMVFSSHLCKALVFSGIMCMSNFEKHWHGDTYIPYNQLFIRFSFGSYTYRCSSCKGWDHEPWLQLWVPVQGASQRFQLIQEGQRAGFCAMASTSKGCFQGNHNHVKVMLFMTKWMITIDFWFRKESGGHFQDEYW
jgi:hypothetical protein